MLNLAHFLDVTAKRYPEATAVILDDVKMTWQEVAGLLGVSPMCCVPRGLAPGTRSP
jgi:hypothetical protein